MLRRRLTFECNGRLMSCQRPSHIQPGKRFVFVYDQVHGLGLFIVRYRLRGWVCASVQGWRKSCMHFIVDWHARRDRMFIHTPESGTLSDAFFGPLLITPVLHLLLLLLFSLVCLIVWVVVLVVFARARVCVFVYVIIFYVRLCICTVTVACPHFSFRYRDCSTPKRERCGPNWPCESMDAAA